MAVCSNKLGPFDIIWLVGCHWFVMSQCHLCTFSGCVKCSITVATWCHCANSMHDWMNTVTGCKWLHYVLPKHVTLFKNNTFWGVPELFAMNISCLFEFENCRKYCYCCSQVKFTRQVLIFLMWLMVFVIVKISSLCEPPLYIHDVPTKFFRTIWV